MAPMTSEEEKFGPTEVRIEHQDKEKDDDVSNTGTDTTEIVYFVNGERKVYVPGSPEEKAMVRKIDAHMFFCVCTLYLLNYLDRTNVSLPFGVEYRADEDDVWTRSGMRKSGECRKT